MKNLDEQRADIALVGLAVMGQNLVLNMSDHGYQVAVYNRSADKLDAFVQADIINQHALDATGGQTYAELDRLGGPHH